MATLTAAIVTPSATLKTTRCQASTHSGNRLDNHSGMECLLPPPPVFYPRGPAHGEYTNMTPETEVIACPACKYLVRVPLDWLGTQVQCPECKAMFRAPVRENGKLTEAELISRPA